MAKKRPNPHIPLVPLSETYGRKPTADGRMRGIDGSMWLWRTVPLGAVLDARTVDHSISVGHSLSTAFYELADLARSRGLNRNMVRSSFREFHLLMTNYPKWFHSDQPGLLGEYLNRSFYNQHVLDRRVLFGVRLTPTVTKMTPREMIQSFASTMLDGEVARDEEYNDDYDRVSAALERAGMGIPTKEDFRSADGWWRHGGLGQTPFVPDPGHIHFFGSLSAAQNAEKQGLDNCEPWLDMAGHSAVTFTTVADTDFGYTDITEKTTWWGTYLTAKHARVVSIRGLVEPPAITQQELKNHRKRVRDDINEAHAKGRFDKASTESKLAEVDAIEQAYDVNKAGMPPTLVDTSIIVGFAGVPRDVSQLSPPRLDLEPMTNRQEQAWHETMMCSPVRANPHLHDFPATVVAYAGLPQISQVGDRDGALLGFTERDAQPVYLSPSAASSKDGAPIMLVAAGTGSGKTVALQWIAHQHTLMGRPSVIIDPKPQSDLSPVVLAHPEGIVRSLDDVVSSDGGLDPLTFFDNPKEGIPLATSMLTKANPWGDEKWRGFEIDIAAALSWAVDQGATATGQALNHAASHGKIDRSIVDAIFKATEVYPLFSATCGMKPASNTLAVSNGITLFRVGKTQLELPSKDMPPSEMNMSQRLSVNLLRMLLRASMSALANRRGVVHMDEAWAIQRATPTELEDLGRLARSLNVLPILYTQTPSGPKNLGLRGYISRGLIGHIPDQDEAAAALEMFDSSSEANLRRVVEEDHLNGSANWNSLKALRVDGKVVRGSIFYYADIYGRLAPVEVRLPQEFLDIASTNPDDIARRHQKA